MTRLLVATTNRGKLEEFRASLKPLGWEVCDLDDFDDVAEAVENGETFAANAASKARHYARLTGLATLADDSGLQVRALDGAPGVRSARFAGDAATDADNIAALSMRMDGIDDRRARFVCRLCLVEDGEITVEVEGRVDGQLLEIPRGSGGFGYDPLFVPDDDRAAGRSFAELSGAEKTAISHRGRAIEAFTAALSLRADDGEPS